MYSIRTRADGACGLHAVFGGPSDEGDFLKPYATEFAASLLGSGWAKLATSDLSKCYADAILESLWSEFVLPVLRNEPSHEGELFWEALGELNLSLQQECIAFFNKSHTAFQEACDARLFLHQESRRFFKGSLEQDVVLPVAKLLGLVPNSFDSARLSDEGYLGTLLQEHPDSSDFLQSACSAEGFVKGTQEQFPLLGPCCKYQALFDERTSFDELREAFVISGGGNCFEFLQALQHVTSTHQLQADQVTASQQFQSVVLHFTKTEKYQHSRQIFQRDHGQHI